KWGFQLPWRLIEPWRLIDRFSSEHGIDPYIVGAIIRKESLGEKYSFRHEPNWKYAYKVDYFAKLIGSSQATEEAGQKSSWGLMHVMGTVARERGFRGWFPELCVPEVGVDYGCRQLRYLKERYPEG